jgi:hypothetical protein
MNWPRILADIRESEKDWIEIVVSLLLIGVHPHKSAAKSLTSNHSSKNLSSPRADAIPVSR